MRPEELKPFSLCVVHCDLCCGLSEYVGKGTKFIPGSDLLNYLALLLGSCLACLEPLATAGGDKEKGRVPKIISDESGCGLLA